MDTSILNLSNVYTDKFMENFIILSEMVHISIFRINKRNMMILIINLKMIQELPKSKSLKMRNSILKIRFLRALSIGKISFLISMILKREQNTL